MSMVERQARRALERELLPGEVVRGFTLCEYDNGRPTLQAFAGRARSKGYFAITDDRLFLIPLRVRDLVEFNFVDIEKVILPVDELLTVSFGRGLVLGMTLNDPRLGRAVMDRFQQLLAAGRETFNGVFRTPDFEQRVGEEMHKHLAAGMARDEAVRHVIYRVMDLIRGFGADKHTVAAAAHAAAAIAEAYPAAGQPVTP
ncbi:hypothetical protein [Blastococcus sp. SYSU DS1021]